MKTCSTCKQSKPLTEFNKARTQPDGHDYRCRECKRASDRAHYARNSERLKAYQKNYRATHAEKLKEYDRVRGKRRRQEHPEQEYLRQKRWKLLNPEKAEAKWRREAEQRTPEQRRRQIENLRLNRKKHPRRYYARKAADYALVTGRLVRQPCRCCGNPKAEAHHPSYAPDRQLDVTWLCRKHHAAWHRLFIAEE